MARGMTKGENQLNAKQVFGVKIVGDKEWKRPNLTF